MDKSWQCQSPRQLQKYVVTWTKKNENLMVRDIDGARNFSDEAWLQKIFEGSTKKRIEYCKDKDGFSYVRFRNTLVVFQSSQNWWVMYLFHVVGIFSQRTFMELPIHIGTWIDFRRKGERQRPSDSLSNTNESFWTRRGRGDRNPRFYSSTESTQHNSLESYPTCNILGTIIKVQEQGLEFWQTKSFAIMTNGTIPGDCIDKIEYFSNDLKSRGWHPK